VELIARKVRGARGRIRNGVDVLKLWKKILFTPMNPQACNCGNPECSYSHHWPININEQGKRKNNSIYNSQFWTLALY